MEQERQMIDLGHWCTYFGQDFEPSDWFGFVYIIKNNLTSQKYIGKKFFRFLKTKKVANSKRRKKTYVDSDWKNYTSSSTEVNRLIQQYGKHNFTFTIVELCKTKGSLAYAEVQWMVWFDALGNVLEDGTKHFYNKSIPGVKFQVPPTTEATRQKLSVTRQQYLDRIGGLSDTTKQRMSDSHKALCQIDNGKALLASARSKKKPQPIRLCSIEGCQRKHRAKDLCSMHYDRQFRNSNPKYLEIGRKSYANRKKPKA
jgi:hypothetical protein